MGQAKRRGSLEVRAAQSVIRQEQEKLEYEIIKQQIEDAKTPEQKQKEADIKKKFYEIATIANAFNYPVIEPIIKKYR